MPPPAPVPKPKAARASKTSDPMGPVDPIHVTPFEPKKHTRDSRTPLLASLMATPSPAPKRQNPDDDSNDEMLRQPASDVDGDDDVLNEKA